MGILRSYARTPAPVSTENIPSGCFSVHREGGIVVSTLPSDVPEDMILEIAGVAIGAIQASQQTNLGVTEVIIRYSGCRITACDLRGGVLVFIHPLQHKFVRKAPPQVMSSKNLEEFILHLEAHIECWKELNHCINLARDKRFTAEDEAMFLDLKSLITQGTEVIAASDIKGGPRKDEVLTLFSAAPSLRYMAEMSDSFASVEGQWHRIYLTLQSLLGHLKVQLTKQGEKPVQASGGGGWSLFGKKK